MIVFSIFSDIATDIKNILKAILKKIVEHLDFLFETIENQILTSKEKLEKINELLKSNISDFFTPFTDKIIQIQQIIIDSIQTQQNSLDISISNIFSTTSNSIELINQTVIDSIQTQQNSLDISISNIFSTTKNSIESINQTVIDQIQTQQNSLDISIQEKIRDSFKNIVLDKKTSKTLDKLLKNSENAINSSFQSLNTQIETSQSSVVNKVEVIETNLNDVVETSFQSLNTQIETSQSSVISNLGNMQNLIFNQIEETNLLANTTIDDIDICFQEFKKNIDTKIDEVAEELTTEELEIIFQTNIENMNDEEIIKATDIVVAKIDEDVIMPKIKQIDWITIKHSIKPNHKQSQTFTINHIYRILCDNFSREDRIALSSRIATKDHYSIKVK